MRGLGTRLLRSRSCISGCTRPVVGEALCVNTILMMLKKVLVPLEWTLKLDVVKHFAKDGSGLRLGRGIKGFVDHFLSLQTKHF